MTRTTRIALTLAVVATLGACDENPTGDETGTVSMLLTDAPGDFMRAIVTIDRIELMRDGNDEGEGEGEGEDEGGRVVLRDAPFTGDLLELSNSVAELVGDEVVPGGAYSQVRFVISGGCIEVETEDGSEVYASAGYTECGTADGDLQMPSFGSSGLKVNLPAGFEVSGDRNIVLIDFDVAESFGHQAGNSGKWVMHPVMRATEVDLSGSLDVTLVVADTVDLPGAMTADSFSIQLDSEPPVTVLDGTAGFDFLLPATYSVSLVAPEGVQVVTDPTLPLDVVVGSAQDADVTITITGVL